MLSLVHLPVYRLYKYILGPVHVNMAVVIVGVYVVCCNIYSC